MSRFNLQQHLEKEHRTAPLSQYLREIVYGGNDGIVTTFAVVAGFAGAQRDPATSAVPLISVLLFGLANLVSDALSMSLGSFLSLRADQDVYKNVRAKEHAEILRQPDNEHAETLEILKLKGFNTEDAAAMARLYRKNPTYWTEFMMRDELQMANPEKENPLFIALSTFFSFVLFGVIPLAPFMVITDGRDLFTISIWCTVGALFLLGMLRALVTQRAALRGIVETLVVGGISAAAAYFVGSFFRI